MLTAPTLRKKLWRNAEMKEHFEYVDGEKVSQTKRDPTMLQEQVTVLVEPPS